MDSCLYDLKEYECGLEMNELSIKCFLFADDQVVLVPSACEQQEVVNKMNDSVKKKGIKVNVSKTKMMAFERGESTIECDLVIEGEKVEQVKEFVYFGSLFTNDDKHDRDIERRMMREIK
ncbi:hypothetical protein EVAR_62726_1 [Eumeta japonica]|uniref:Reverse transcriptase domain-containing protein n=1 Tax=Eumeta variegata TaxID=151549 RepID=A0A4C1ZGX9_EUMVA|nr:hypothetical protein EVAR_62726_1 [Eumeta japonica]